MRTALSCSLLGVVTLLAMSPSASAEDRQLSIGAGAAYGSVFEGSAQSQVDPIPIVNARWGRFFINDVGVGADILSEWGARELTLGLAVFAGEGRDESDDSRIRGLGDVDTAIEAKVFATMEVGPFDLEAVVARDLGSGHEGTYIDLSISTEWQVSQRLNVEVGPELRFADARYTRAFYGVSASQAVRSGLPAFKASSGFVWGTLSASLGYAITEHWSLFATGEVGLLFGDARRSPVSAKNRFGSIGTGLVYSFY